MNSDYHFSGCMFHVFDHRRDQSPLATIPVITGAMLDACQYLVAGSSFAADTTNVVRLNLSDVIDESFFIPDTVERRDHMVAAARFLALMLNFQDEETPVSLIAPLEPLVLNPENCYPMNEEEKAMKIQPRAHSIKLCTMLQTIGGFLGFADLHAFAGYIGLLVQRFAPTDRIIAFREIASTLRFRPVRTHRDYRPPTINRSSYSEGQNLVQMPLAQPAVSFSTVPEYPIGSVLYAPGVRTHANPGIVNPIKQAFGPVELCNIIKVLGFGDFSLQGIVEDIPHTEIVVAGGSLCHAFQIHMESEAYYIADDRFTRVLPNRVPIPEYKGGDIDMFIVGKDTECARVRQAYLNNIIWNVVQILQSSLTFEDDVREILVTEKAVTISIWDKNHKQQYRFQIILRVYDSIAHVLETFDNHACQLAFNGETFFATPGAIQAHHTRSLVVNPLTMEPCNAKRLLKYWYRGFTLIVPYPEFLNSAAQPDFVPLIEKLVRISRSTAGDVDSSRGTKRPKLAASFAPYQDYLSDDDSLQADRDETACVSARIKQVWQSAFARYVKNQNKKTWLLQIYPMTVTPAAYPNRPDVIQVAKHIKALVTNVLIVNYNNEDTPPRWNVDLKEWVKEAELVKTSIVDPLDQSKCLNLAVFKGLPYFTRCSVEEMQNIKWERAPSPLDISRERLSRLFEA